jgi:hypothetical protein
MCARTDDSVIAAAPSGVNGDERTGGGATFAAGGSAGRPAGPGFVEQAARPPAATRASARNGRDVTRRSYRGSGRHRDAAAPQSIALDARFVFEA